ncbi:MAG: nicotinate-nucleotide adenylyltransferase [Bacteroidales bacterium]|nr:nicotinate-nucleotide adenylyltransferase [Bacteroidales bacterium]
MKQRQIGIFGGTFDPIHNGHTMLASYLAQWGPLDEVWLMPSRINPLKEAKGAAGATTQERVEMVEIAISSEPRLSCCLLELEMPSPSYTINTLDALSARYPDAHFRWIIGSDNWQIIDRWRAYQRIISQYGLIVYPRPGYDIEPSALPPQVAVVTAPTFEISSTWIRQAIAEGKNLNLFLPSGVYDYIQRHNIYRR